MTTVDRKKYRDPQPINVEGVRDLGTLSHKCDVLIKSLPPRFRELCGRGDRKSVSTREDAHHRGNKAFQMEKG